MVCGGYDELKEEFGARTDHIITKVDGEYVMESNFTPAILPREERADSLRADVCFLEVQT